MSFNDFIIPALQAVTIPMWVLMIVAPQWHVTKKITVPIAVVPTLAGAVGYLITELPALTKVLFGSTTAPFANYEGLVEFFAIQNIQIGAWLAIVALDLFTAMWMFQRLHDLKAKTSLISVLALVVFLFPQFCLLLFLVVVRPILRRRQQQEEAAASADTEQKVPATVF
ncbi:MULTISPECIES: abscisic acid-deficient protein Aba4 family protein [unclassified Streptomyces]|uniref:abscisic acid-deficient protein Aba4 family protein n=1 Tax=unclassified Streptomyces TaxID=2593676 RepID=UPI001BE7DAF3|nr:abscisic acid-deficient protein Aba4 family protein [Streptomyces sp. McG3]MBT2897692.1 DUF4281 domain-containing protein [Streptomyces sp. McG3]